MEVINNMKLTAKDIAFNIQTSRTYIDSFYLYKEYLHSLIEELKPLLLGSKVIVNPHSRFREDNVTLTDIEIHLYYGIIYRAEKYDSNGVCTSYNIHPTKIQFI